ncbi:hypothetical protein KL918_000418 [Ogataea parapolymorpha]|nr:hypothetical protein KL918_000418 [Ogataea parapolymorpha]KAG7875163.1 hypothetical protein KL916_000775 [Ogataea parapolymorpha]
MDLDLNRDLQDFQHLLNDLQVNLYEFKHLKITNDTDLEFIRLNTQAQTTDLYEKLEELENIITAKLDCVSGDIQEDMEYQFALLKERFFDVRVDFRELLLSSKSWTVQEEEEQTDELTNEPILDDHNLKKLTKEEQLLNKNSLLTSKLQSVNQLLQSSLLASEMNISDLAHSTNSLTTLSNKYSYFTDVLVRSNKLVRTINESSSKERKQIYSSLKKLSCGTDSIYERHDNGSHCDGLGTQQINPTGNGHINHPIYAQR